MTSFTNLARVGGETVELPFTYEETSRFVKAGDITLHYNEVGSGPPVFMIHGGGPGAGAWSNFKQNALGFSDRYRVLMLDLPGYGESDKPPIAGDVLEYFAHAVDAMMDSLGLERAHFVGNSLGGATSYAVALHHPERVDRLALMGPGGLAARLTTPYDIYTNASRFITSFYEDPDRQGIRTFCEQMVTDKSLLTDELIEERFASSTDPEHIEWMRDFFRRMGRGGTDGAYLDRNLWKRVDEVQAKTLLVWGYDDVINPVDNALFALRYMPDCRLHILPHSGHWAHFEQQPEFDTITMGFLSMR